MISRKLWEEKLNGAVCQGKITPVFQPIIDSASGLMTGAEVLARWYLPNGTSVPPSEFIPHAMIHGQIVPLTLGLIQQVKNFFKSAGLVFTTPLTVGFNAEQACLCDKTFEFSCRKFISELSPLGVNLALEVTEREPLSEETLGTLRRLQSAGIKVVLDDYGTGFSTEAVLSSLQPDIVKTDRSLTRLAGIGDPEGVLTKCLLTLLRIPGLTVLAEGVETFQEINWLRRRNITLLQGFALSSPLSPEIFASFCNKNA